MKITDIEENFRKSTDHIDEYIQLSLRERYPEWATVTLDGQFSFSELNTIINAMAKAIDEQSKP